MKRQPSGRFEPSSKRTAQVGSKCCGLARMTLNELSIELDSSLKLKMGLSI